MRCVCQRTDTPRNGAHASSSNPIALFVMTATQATEKPRRCEETIS
jgi:hypothetical protein